MLDFFDTSTLPTEEMRAAMAQAELGDDVYRDDPTVNELERTTAELLGTEEAVFLPSGTMANLAAVLGHAIPGDEVIVASHAHLLTAEAGGVAAIAGVMPRPVWTERGVLTGEVIRQQLRDPDPHYPRTALVWVENTHNVAGGTVTTPAEMIDLREVCAEQGLRLHVDGARLFNAAVALDVPVQALTAGADSVCVALSKGLGAPAGSMLAGSATFVAGARRSKKLLGGAMRQVGMLAAAGLVALRTGVGRLADDHRRARHLAAGLAEIPGVDADPAAVETNIVLADVAGTGMGAREAAERLRERGVKVAARPPHRLRFVTHLGIDDGDVDRALAIVAEASDRRRRCA